VNNSLRYLQYLVTQIDDNKLQKIYLDIYAKEYKNELINENVLDKLKQDDLDSKQIELFKNHIKILILYHNKINHTIVKANNLNLKYNLNLLKQKYIKYSESIIKKSQFTLYVLGIVLLLILVWFFIYSHKIAKEKVLLERFRKAVENNQNVIVVTDTNLKIKYINDSFSKIYGFSKDEAIGQSVGIVKSGLHNDKYYKNINDTIFSGKTWYGEFINKTKDKKLVYEKATITPIYNDKNEIEEFLSIKLDITKDKQLEKDLRDKERLLMQQSKLASMGEMIGNIAHQWRQPLSTISTISTGMLLQQECGLLDKETVNHDLKKVTQVVQHLSQTIEDFRNFYKTDKTPIDFHAKDIIDEIKKLIGVKFNNLNIDIVEDIDDVDLYTLKNELFQAIINIINNAKDALSEKENDKYIFATIKKDNNNIVFTIKDSANGIKEDIIDKIFEPYFTTKHRAQGTGIGLYMTYQIIVNHLHGQIFAQNSTYTYNNKQLTGAKFTIIIPKNMKSSNS